MKQLINQPEFRQWIQRSLQQQENILAVSNQGTLLHYRGNGLDLVVDYLQGE